ncbi:outer membrane beta-barrel protein [Undibacterium luofuense]|uniref:Porin family protein n=1 Tax=Undibacterium luofuense TaxID=2828733 RepID=A0A941I6Y0_9BURK|nr:outer membrane beta-barrel protein [Undibacterium luofuense]MBR7783176.1 porin family protein [Undibacterium luofuense]
MKKLLISTYFFTGLLTCAAASAQVYIGGSVGRYNWDAACVGISCKTSDTGFSVFGGYQINSTIAAELSYKDTGTLHTTGSSAGNLPTDVKGKSLAISALANAPIYQDLSAFAKFGIGYMRAEIRNGALGNFDHSSWQPVLGVGLNYKLNKNLTLRGEVESQKFDMSYSKKSMLGYSAGLQYAF